MGAVRGTAFYTLKTFRWIIKLAAKIFTVIFFALFVITLIAPGGGLTWLLCLGLAVGTTALSAGYDTLLLRLQPPGADYILFD